jgi:Tol biopolymer transport system component
MIMNGSVHADSGLSDLSGSIEYDTKDWMAIRRIVLPSVKVETIFNPPDRERIAAHDTTRDGKIRVLSILSFVSHSFHAALLRDGNLTMLTNNKDSFGGRPSLSHDGKLIAYAGKGGIWVMDVDGSSKKMIVDFVCGSEFKTSWFPNNKFLVAGTLDWRIYLISIAKGTKKEIIDFGRHPAVSGDGKKIAYLSREGDEEDKETFRNAWRYAGQGDKYLEHLSPQKRLKWDDRRAIYIYDVDTGKSTKVTDYLNIINAPLIWSPDSKYVAFTKDWERNMFVLNTQTREIINLPGMQGFIMAWTK